MFLTAIITRFGDLSAAKDECQTIADIATPILIGWRMCVTGRQRRKKDGRSPSSPCRTYSSRRMRLHGLDCQLFLVYEDATFVFSPFHFFPKNGARRGATGKLVVKKSGRAKGYNRNGLIRRYIKKNVLVQ